LFPGQIASVTFDVSPSRCPKTVFGALRHMQHKLLDSLSPALVLWHKYISLLFSKLDTDSLAVLVHACKDKLTLHILRALNWNCVSCWKSSIWKLGTQH